MNNKSDGIDTQVMFQLRNEHYDHCTKHGIDVSSYHGDFSIPPEKLIAYQTTEDMAMSVNDGGIFDWVIVALKSTSVSSGLYKVPAPIDRLTGIPDNPRGPELRINRYSKVSL